MKIMKAQDAKSFYLKSGKPTSLFKLCILLFCLVPLLKATTEDNTIFNLTAFNPNMHEIVYEGDASPSDKKIQLTRNHSGSVGRATYYKPMHLKDFSSGDIVVANFTTQLSFVTGSVKSSATEGTGFAFFLAPNDSKIPPDSAGGSYGLGDTTSFVAVAFDMYSNEVAIGRGPVMSSAISVPWSWSDAENRKVDALISYDSTAQSMTVLLQDTHDITDINSLNLSTTLDLGNVLPEWVTFGFSGTTESLFGLPLIYSWNFRSSLQVATTASDPNKAPTPAPAVATNPTSPAVDDHRPDPDPNLNHDRRRKNRTGLAAGLGAAGAFVGVMVLVWLAIRKKFQKDEEKGHLIDEEIDDEFERGTGPRKFSYNELAHATDNFKDDEKLGQGGFGGVYKGLLRESSSYVAIKRRVSSGTKQGRKEYESEVKIISRLRHRNLVKLIGWCHEKGELMLVYEFMANGSLDHHLFKGKSLLTWDVRFKIVKDLASVLHYLHEEGDHCVLHRDIKASNIMLDSSFNAKLGDFGLARLVDHATGSRFTRLAGTLGYIAPEYVSSGKASKESDIYSFGVVALEIACGRRSGDTEYDEYKAELAAWVWDLYGKGRLLDVADQKLCLDFDPKQMECLLMIGLWCVHPDHNSRPSIRQAIQVLNFEAPLPDLPGTRPTPTYGVPAAFGVTASQPYFSILSITLPR